MPGAKAENTAGMSLKKELRGSEGAPAEVETAEAMRGLLASLVEGDQNRYRLLLDNTREIFFILDKKGRVIFANKSALTTLGYSEKEVLGKSIIRLLTPDYHKKALAALFLEFMGRPQPGMEVRARTKSGEIITLKVGDGSIPVYENGGLIGVMISAMDITAEREAEKALQDSERRFRELWEKAPVAYHTLDTNGTITDVNQTEAEMLGYTKEEMIGHSIFDFILPEQRPEAMSRYRQKIAGGTVSKAVGRIYVRKDGSEIFVDINDVLEKDRRGRIVGVRTTMVDITQRKRAEELLRESEERFKQVAENSKAWIWEVDAEGLYTYSSPVVEEILGYKSEEVVGRKHFYDLFCPEEREELKKAAFAAFAEKKPIRELENRNIHKNGQTVWLLTSGVPVLGGKGELRGYRGTDADITERKQAEEAIRESGERFRSVVEHSHEGILVLDDDFRIIYVNNEGIRISGYAREELVSRDFREFVADESKKQVAEFYVRRQRGEPVPPRYEFNILRKGGEKRCVEISSSVIKDSKGKVETMAQILDITERKRAKEQVEESFVNLRKAMNGIIQAIALTVERRDPYTAGHQRRVADLARAIATTMSLPKEQIEGIRIAGVIHDIGKIAVPAEILSRPGRLSEHEFSLIKEHSKIGYEILKEIEFPWPIAQIVFQHHERLDGSGYPQGLTGQDILLEARILAVSDVVEAMVSHRPYRPAHDVEKAMDEILMNRATLYDPGAVDACVSLFREKEFKFR